MHLTSKKLYISKEAFAGEIRIPRRRSAALHTVWGEALCLVLSYKLSASHGAGHAEGFSGCSVGAQ